MTDHARTLTPEFYDNCISEIGGSIDEKRWLLASLAAQARADGIADWAERMARHPKVSRKRSTIYEWVAVLDFRNRLSRSYNLLFSHYAAAVRKVDKLGLEKCEEVLEQAEQEQMTIEETQTLFSDLAKPDPEPFSLAAWLADEYLRTQAAIDDAHGFSDVEALQRLANSIEAERAKLAQAGQLVRKEAN